MNAVSLYTGIGGLDLGLEAVGMSIVAMAEIDPFCREVLTCHWPEVPLHDDVRTFPTWWTGERPAVDLVFGGFPCQGHSAAGRQRGIDDPRWGWPAFLRAARHVSTPLILIENVPNLTRTGLRDILEDLADLGFDAWWARVPAAAMGAPHLRWRLFVVAADPQRVKLRIEPRWSSGPDGPHTTLVGVDGATWALADPTSDGWSPWAGLRPGAAGEEAAPLLLGEPRDGGQPGPGSVAHTEGLGRGQGRVGGRGEPDGAPPAGAGAGTTEPHVGRVADGLPAGLDGHHTRDVAAGHVADSDLLDGGAGRPGGPALPGQPRDHLTPAGMGAWPGHHASGLAHPWAVEPDVGRVAHGVPARMDRLRALGNAVVPQVAGYVGSLIVSTFEVVR